MTNADLREAVCDAVLDITAKTITFAACDRIIALVVARCAEVAEAKAEAWWTDPTEKHYRTASQEIADEIRALAQEPSHER